MSVQIIPTTADPFYSQLVTLEGTAYLLSFQYNQRENTWYMSVADAEGNDIYNGIKLVCSWPLTRQCADPNMPQGEFMVISSTADTSPPGLSDLQPSGRCVLNYFTSDELP